MEKKIRISEFEKELQKIDENVAVVRTADGCGYNIRFDLPGTY